jgi:enterochelin esterase-like enzyme/quercetin dioxygenase-like cupin family protein
MKQSKLLFVQILMLITAFATAQIEPKHGTNSYTYPGIPKGKVTKYVWKSKVYENTIRDYYIYVPAQYDGTKEAALMIFQDGHNYAKEDGDYRVPVVFDNLIAQGKMPLTIGLFINPGHDTTTPAQTGPWKASNRSVEYDDVSDKYGKMLVQEFLPELNKNYKISSDPKMRAVCGLSSGGICAFTAAWFFPNQFQKVMSHIGSFTDIRGGDKYPSMIRKADKKELKVYLQDGRNDLDNQYGNWYLGNQQMEAALKYKKYEYKFVVDDGGHVGKYAGPALPEGLEWLWADVVMKQVASKVHSPRIGSDTLFAGKTMHFSNINFLKIPITSASGNVSLTSTSEQMIIVKDGEINVKLKNEKVRKLGPQSIIFIAPNDVVSITAASPQAVYYDMKYSPISKNNGENKKPVSPSFIMDFKDIAFTAHDRGGVRNYFNLATPSCPYYEMHMTSLNTGIKSHEPHTHKAEEIVLMLEGNTEMEVGNKTYQAKAGDVYYQGAHVPHAIKNIGTEQCRYIAFQWN